MDVLLNIEIAENSLQITLKSHSEVLTREGLTNRACPHVSGPAHVELKSLLTCLISSFPAACEIRINTEWETARHTAKRDAPGVFVKHERRN